MGSPIPLDDPHAAGRVAAFIEKILTHLGLWPAQAHSPPAGYPLPFSLQRVVTA
jgi:hypothetical protein